DRAALICAPSFEVAVSALLKTSGDKLGEVDVPDYLANLPERGGVGKYADIFRSHPLLSTRIRALQLFSESRFHRKLRGHDDLSAPGAEAVDTQVTELLS